MSLSKAKRWLVPLLFACSAGAYLKPAIDIQTKDSLTLTAGTYRSLLFRAAKSTDEQGNPIPYTFRTSGEPPKGMIFEGYPCHKPGLENCPALASSDGIYLDGVPEAAGSYRISIRAETVTGESGTREFVITVKPATH
jgi:hypothetical protein